MDWRKLYCPTGHINCRGLYNDTAILNTGLSFKFRLDQISNSSKIETMIAIASKSKEDTFQHPSGDSFLTL